MKAYFETAPYNHNNFPIYITKEKFYASVPFTTYTNWHDDIEFVKILSGEITYNINGEIIRLSKGQGLFINSNQIHSSFFNEDNDCEFLCMIFQPSLLCAKKHYTEQYLLPILTNHAIPYYIFRDDVPWEKKVIRQIQAIYDIRAEKDFELLFTSIFFSMWADIYKNLDGTQKIVTSDTGSVMLFKKMISFMFSHYKEKISLDDICQVGNVCKTTCINIFRKHTGFTPNEYLTKHRLRMAISLMQDRDITLDELCYECGFSNASYFAETFKKFYGVSPKKYILNVKQMRQIFAPNPSI